MPDQEKKNDASTASGDQKPEKPPAKLKPSASIVILSPTNQVLLVKRVAHSSSFPSAHVFPGGNLSAFQDGPLPKIEDPEFHEDCLAYRLAAIRETFEESNILLAKKLGRPREEGLVKLDPWDETAGREMVRKDEVNFLEWLKDHGGEPDVEGLIPFTRWITPIGPKKRYTTQMYLYMLPTTGYDLPPHGDSSDYARHPNQLVWKNPSFTPPHVKDKTNITHHTMVVATPTDHDSDYEITEATFDDAGIWLHRARKGWVVLFPPQYFLLQLICKYLPPAPQTAIQRNMADLYYEHQRKQLLDFVRRTPTSQRHPDHPTSAIPWADKVISPTVLFVRKGDRKVVMGLDKPGPELRDSGKGGDWERAVVLDFKEGQPRNLELRSREEVVAEEKARREWDEKRAKEKAEKKAEAEVKEVVVEEKTEKRAAKL